MQHIVDFFLKPRTDEDSTRARRTDALSGQIAVLGRPKLASASAGVFANAIRAAHKRPCGVVAVWPGAAVQLPHTPSSRKAQELRKRFATRGLDAQACGRVVWISLRDDPGEARTEIARVNAASPVPIAFACVGPRHSGLDEVLQDSAVIALVDGEQNRDVRALALEDLGSFSARVLCVPPVRFHLLQQLALSGYLRLPLFSQNGAGEVRLTSDVAGLV